MPVVILEPDVASRPQHLSILQPRDVRGRLTLGLAGEHGCGSSWPGYGLGVLNKLCWRWVGTEKHEGQVDGDEAAVNEGMRKGKRGWRLGSARDGVGSRRWWPAPPLSAWRQTQEDSILMTI